MWFELSCRLSLHFSKLQEFEKIKAVNTFETASTLAH